MVYYAVYVNRKKKQNLLPRWRGQKPMEGSLKTVWRPVGKK
jgi:hypothetical protein